MEPSLIATEERKSSTHKVEVVPISLEKHLNADKLSIVRVYGFTVVVRTEDWQGVTRAAYLPPDSLVSITRDEFSFLASEANSEGKVRIKAKKLRGVLSFGLLVPAPADAAIGDDVADQLGVEHYEPPIKGGGGPGGIKMGGEVAKPPAVGFVKYDLEAGRRYAQRAFVPGEPTIVTEKIHGCLRADMMVTMGDKTERPISNIKVGDLVMSYNRAVEDFIPKKVTNVLVRPADNRVKWLKLRLDNDKELVITSDHPILTSIGWVAAENITEEHNIVSY